MKNKILTATLGIFIALFIITFSIGLPIYFRPFYYMQIESLGIPEMCGESYETIKDAYDEVLDYLTLPGKEFGAGVFKYSEEGKSHFVECKVLFDLNASVLIISIAAIAILLILAKKKIFQICKPFGLNLLFSSGAFTLGFFALVGGLVAIDFSAAFTVFHKIFFPGKSNWLFDWYEDQVIRILPQEFFMNCAILIFSSIVILCISAIVYSIVAKMLEKNKD